MYIGWVGLRALARAARPCCSFSPARHANDRSRRSHYGARLLTLTTPQADYIKLLMEHGIEAEALDYNTFLAALVDHAKASYSAGLSLTQVFTFTCISHSLAHRRPCADCAMSCRV